MLGGSNEGEDDTESESSSSYRNMSTQFKSALDDFREKWQKELKTEPSTLANPNPIDHESASASPDDETRAEELFMQGVEYEKRGKVYDALTYYRRAVQIVPDIEFRIYESAKKAQAAAVGSEVPIPLDEVANCDENSPTDPLDNEDLTNVDLFVRFQNAILKSECGLINRANVAKGMIITGAHISDLPLEILLYVLRWVVSAQLDLRSLEQCAAVCKGFYLCARDEEIWRLACLKVWGVNIGLLDNSAFPTWREMFIERHRVLFNGCYISKTSYMRYGENSFQDQFYRPVQKIEYYRYIRFFPDGMVQMMTSADDPGQTVSKLRTVNSRPEILKGDFRLHGDQIIIVLKRNVKVQSYANSKKRGGSNEPDTSGTQSFFIELSIMSTSKRKFSQLIWKRYTFNQEKNNNKEVTTDFELTTSKYPPFWFSRVKSYHLESDAPLQ